MIMQVVEGTRPLFHSVDSLRVFPLSNLEIPEIRRRALSALAEEEYAECLINVEELVRRYETKIDVSTRNIFLGNQTDTTIAIEVDRYSNHSSDVLKEDLLNSINSESIDDLYAARIMLQVLIKKEK